MNKILVTLALLVSTISFNVRAADAPHVVFLVHGFLGDHGTFGALPQILRARYGKMTLVKELYYPTSPWEGNAAVIKKMIPYEFAQVINTQIVNYFVEQGLPSDTPISFIAHSQGAVVTMRYINTCLGKFALKQYCTYQDGIQKMTAAGWFDAKERPKWLGVNEPGLQARLAKDYAKKVQFASPSNIKNLVTLAAPFWGAALANQYLTEHSLVAKVVDTFNFPAQQIINLSIGSQEPSRLHWVVLNNGVSTDRDETVDLRPFSFDGIGDSGWNNPYSKIKIFSVSGFYGLAVPVTTQYGSFLLSSPTRSLELENDVVVAVPESHLDFIYHIENVDGTLAMEGMTTPTKGFYPGLMSHLSLPGAKAIAYVKADSYQEHLSYIVIKKVLDNEFGLDKSYELSQADKNKYFLGSISNFTSDIKLKTPPGYQRELGMKRISVAPQDPSAFKNVMLDKSFLANTNGQNNNGSVIKNYYSQTFYHIGKVADKYALMPKKETLTQATQSRGFLKIDYKFKILGFQEKATTLNVFPSMNTYAELYLTPYQPIQPSNVQITTGGKTFAVVNLLRRAQSYFQTLVLDNGQVRRAEFIYSLQPSDISTVDACYVGLLSKPSPDQLTTQIDKAKNFRQWEEKAFNKLYFFRNFADKNTIEFHDKELAKFAKGRNDSLEYGHPLEILGRYKATINDLYVDRYLVTSPEIRDFDQPGMKFSGIGAQPGLGLRWVNAVDIDVIDEPIVVKISSHINNAVNGYVPAEYFSWPQNNACLKDNGTYQYPGNAYFQKKYYNQ